MDEVTLEFLKDLHTQAIILLKRMEQLHLEGEDSPEKYSKSYPIQTYSRSFSYQREVFAGLLLSLPTLYWKTNWVPAEYDPGECSPRAYMVTDEDTAAMGEEGRRKLKLFSFEAPDKVEIKAALEWVGMSFYAIIDECELYIRGDRERPLKVKRNSDLRKHRYFKWSGFPFTETLPSSLVEDFRQAIFNLGFLVPDISGCTSNDEGSSSQSGDQSDSLALRDASAYELHLNANMTWPEIVEEINRDINRDNRDIGVQSIDQIKKAVERYIKQDPQNRRLIPRARKGRPKK